VVVDDGIFDSRPDPVFRRHWIVFHALLGQNGADTKIVAISVGVVMLVESIFAEAGALIHAENAADGPRRSADGSPDDCTYRTGCAVALRGTAFGAAYETLCLHREGSSDKNGRERNCV
jgi:hypothetical protein